MGKHLKNYFFSTLAIRAIGIFTIPITTRFLMPEDIGNISLFTSYSSLALVLLTINSHSSISRYYFEYTNDFKSFVSTSFYLSIFSSVIIGSLIFIFSKIKLIDLEISNSLIIVIIFNTILNTLTSIFIQINESKSNSGLIAKRTIFAGITQFLISILAVIFAPNPKWIYVITANIFSSFIISIFFFRYVKSYITKSFNIKHIKYILSYSIPLIPYSLGSLILSQIDRILISKHSGLDNTGIFSIAANLAMLIVIFSDSLNKAWMPKYFELMNENKFYEHDIGVKSNLDKWTFFSVLFITFFYEPLLFLIGNKFVDALPVIPIVIISYFFYFTFTTYSRNIGYKKQNIYTALLMFISGITNILLSNYFLINFDYRFVVLATLLSYILLLIMGWFVSKYVLKFHTTNIIYLLKNLVIISIVSLLFYFLFFLNFNVFLTIIIKYLFCFIILKLLFKKTYFQVLSNLKFYLYEVRSNRRWQNGKKTH